MSKRIVSIWFPWLATDRLSRRLGSAWRDNPAAVVAQTGNRTFVEATNRPAEATGIFPGMPLADARALVPGLKVTPSDPTGDAAVLHRLARWCERYTPWAAPEGCSGLFLDISGCAHLVGGEEALLADMARRFSDMNLTVRLAIASTAGAAWGVSHHGQDGTIVPPGQQRDVLALLPVAALRLDTATLMELGRLGLKSVRDLLALPRATLAARFGSTIGRRLDQALGDRDEPISPLQPAPSHRVRMHFPEPIGTATDIAAALDRLLRQLCHNLERADLGGRRFELTLFRADHSTQTLIVGTGQPLRNPRRLSRLFAERLDTLDPGFGIETLMLRTFATEALAANQTALATKGLEADAATGRDDDLADLIDRLSNRLGPARVVRFAPAASHMPERTFQALPAGGAPTIPHWTKTGTAPPRPLRLLKQPEPLDTIALVADGEPGDPPATFSWRKRDRQVRCASGPERILPEWWQGDGAWNGEPRDYWRVQDEAGEQFWLFREGSLRDGSPPRWFLHGVFT